VSARRSLRFARAVLLTFGVSALFELCCSPTDADNYLYPYRDPYLATHPTAQTYLKEIVAAGRTLNVSIQGFLGRQTR
jgi:hypothetical protein